VERELRKIVGAEVKKGENVRSRSLNVFIGTYRPAYSIHLSLKNFGEKDNLKSVPLYPGFPYRYHYDRGLTPNAEYRAACFTATSLNTGALPG
jgi:hypothetical protein